MPCTMRHFPQLRVRLRVLPLADSVGLVMGLGLKAFRIRENWCGLSAVRRAL